MDRDKRTGRKFHQRTNRSPIALEGGEQEPPGATPVLEHQEHLNDEPDLNPQDGKEAAQQHHADQPLASGGRATLLKRLNKVCIGDRIRQLRVHNCPQSIVSCIFILRQFWLGRGLL